MIFNFVRLVVISLMNNTTVEFMIIGFSTNSEYNHTFGIIIACIKTLRQPYVIYKGKNEQTYLCFTFRFYSCVTDFPMARKRNCYASGKFKFYCQIDLKPITCVYLWNA